MTPSPQAQGALPPLPDLQSQGGTGGGQTGAQPDVMASLISGIAPVKNGVDMALQGLKMIAQSGAVPGVEQILGPMIQQLNSILVMTAQQALQPGGGQGAQAPAPQGPFSLGAPPGAGGAGPQ